MNYKSDPVNSASRPPSVNIEDKKTQDLELKVKDLTEQVNQLRSSLNRMTRTIRRQSADIASLASAVNRFR
jgi:septal ring factor EnvC (AmiA/AmiB activator)